MSLVLPRSRREVPERVPSGPGGSRCDASISVSNATRYFVTAWVVGTLTRPVGAMEALQVQSADFSSIFVTLPIGDRVERPDRHQRSMPSLDPGSLLPSARRPATDLRTRASCARCK